MLNAKKEYKLAKQFAADKAEVGIFMEEYNKFETDEYKRRVANARKFISRDINNIADIDGNIVAEAKKMPKKTKEQKIARKHDIAFAKSVLKSQKLMHKNYPNGIVEPSKQALKEAYAMPDGTSKEHKSRNKAIKSIEKQFDVYYKSIAPYKEAEKLVKSFENHNDVLEWSRSKYDEACEIIREREEAENKKSNRANKKHRKGDR